MREFLRLIKLVKHYWSQLAAALALMTCSGIFEGLVALLIGPVIDRVLNPSSGGSHVVLLQNPPLLHHPLYLNEFMPQWFSHNPASIVAGALVFMVGFKGISMYFAIYFINYAGFGVVTDLRNNLYEKLLNQSASFFQKHSTSKLMSTAINDIDRIQTAASYSLADAMRQIVTLVAMLAVLLLLNWKLTLGAALLMPLVIIPSARLGKKVRRTTRRGQDELADVQHILHETLTGNRIVKAFNMEWREVQRFREAAMKLLRSNLRYIQTQGVSSPLMELVGSITIALFILYGRGAINRQVMTTGTVFAFLYALFRLYQPLRRMTGIYNSFETAMGSAQQVFVYMDMVEDVRERPHATPLKRFDGNVRFDHVEFSYEANQPLLRGIDLEVRRGEVVAFVGSSGAGKTTLVNLIPRFFDVTGGRVLIDGHDVRDLTLRSLREHIAYVTQDTILFNDTVAHNIAYGTHNASRDQIEAAARAALAEDFITAMPEGYQTILGERGLRLSGGQRQRIAIARAILKNAPILILDEATSALDSESEMLVQSALGNLMEGRTVFVIAHRLATVRRADRIVVIDGGRIAEMGNHEELYAANGNYRRLYDLQFTDLDRIPETDPLPLSEPARG
jgi:subfamily B ATP-binding cassette protein MsbA